MKREIYDLEPEQQPGCAGHELEFVAALPLLTAATQPVGLLGRHGPPDRRFCLGGIKSLCGWSDQASSLFSELLYPDPAVSARRRHPPTRRRPTSASAWLLGRHTVLRLPPPSFGRLRPATDSWRGRLAGAKPPRPSGLARTTACDVFLDAAVRHDAPPDLKGSTTLTVLRTESSECWILVVAAPLLFRQPMRLIRPHRQETPCWARLV